MELLLMTPGPTRVPERVLAAGAIPMIHHRTDEFGRMLGSVIEKLRPLFGTGGDILPVHSTGRGALEAAITNLCSPGDEIVVCCDGVFGEMWADIADAFGVVAHRISPDWGVAVDPADVETAFRAHPFARAVLLAHSDTSTGALNDVAAIARVAGRAGALVMVDGVSSIGGTPFRFDEWGVDLAITASQKCLMSSPGIAFVAISQRAWDAYSTARLPRSYFDFQAIRKTLARTRPETPSTTPVHLIAQVNAALELIEAEGLDQIFARHAEMARIARSRAASLGLSPQCPGLTNLSPTLTGLRVPDGVSPARIREQLKARGILVGPGLRRYEPTCFRIGHMGDIRPADVHRTMDALAEVLGAAGR
ncbi:MAG: alanine--glyoxylate aminotransferase family protein [Acidobacteria bacterium]|nr:alanine--glyoxylate aminotransferase family protein [Acidobacteriota bacterium]